MTMAILPKHLLEGENMQESDFFRAPVGTGPYKLESWDEGQSIVLVKNEDYYLGAPKIDKVIFKIVPDDNAQAMQLESGELDLALLDPKNAQNFKEKDGFTCYDMTTADYRGILFNFANDYWTKNRDIIPAVCYSIDRQAIIDSVLLGEGMAAYSPLQRNIYNNENVEHYDYNPEKLEIRSVGKEHAFGFHDSVGEIAGGDIVVLLSVETEETGTQVTNSVNVKHHFYHPPKNQKVQSNGFEAPKQETHKSRAPYRESAKLWRPARNSRHQDLAGHRQ